ncbi:hypothetical protein TSAR_016423 [Trichomalopsis sarcophagae]|uniref:Uncharacterized protein n=1 Tax=Trichomalopsis sarcophagae TaxID=543379 RepID=A0A232EPZ1_9HYME|nr:hypothetical protein TSAR_016423 [Trichomalopsis sarcophagae]
MSRPSSGVEDTLLGDTSDFEVDVDVEGNYVLISRDNEGGAPPFIEAPQPPPTTEAPQTPPTPEAHPSSPPRPPREEGPPIDGLGYGVLGQWTDDAEYPKHEALWAYEPLDGHVDKFEAFFSANPPIRDAVQETLSRIVEGNRVHSTLHR